MPAPLARKPTASPSSLVFLYPAKFAGVMVNTSLVHPSRSASVADRQQFHYQLATHHAGQHAAAHRARNLTLASGHAAAVVHHRALHAIYADPDDVRTHAKIVGGRSLHGSVQYRTRNNLRAFQLSLDYEPQIPKGVIQLSLDPVEDLAVVWTLAADDRGRTVYRTDRGQVRLRRPVELAWVQIAASNRGHARAQNGAGKIIYGDDALRALRQQAEAHGGEGPANAAAAASAGEATQSRPGTGTQPRGRARRGEEPGPSSSAGGVSTQERSKVMATLKSAPIAGDTALGGGINETRIVQLEGDGSGVFKPRDGEHQGARASIPGDYWRREVASSAVADLLGLGDLVPATTARNIGGKVGSVQQFVPNAKPALGLDESARYGPPRQQAKVAAFDFLTGNTDRHLGNWLVKDDGTPVLIDNGLSFPISHKPEFGNSLFVEKAANGGTPIPPEVHHWKAQWPKIEAVLKRHVGVSATALAKQRLDAMTAPGIRTFADVLKDSRVNFIHRAQHHAGTADQAPSPEETV